MAKDTNDMWRHSIAVNQRRKGFTLIELLVVIGIIALLAAILFPVFGMARKSGRTTAALAQIKQVGLANHLYAGDNNDGIVITDTNWFQHPIWSELLTPYAKSRDIFWDPTRLVLKQDTYGSYHWSQITTFAINDSGFAGSWVTDGGCRGGNWRFIYGRKLSKLEDISQRVAFVPTIWGGTNVGWYYIRAYQSNWLDPSKTAGTWSWYNLIWDTRFSYAGDSIPVARADGSAGKIKRADFVDWNEAPTWDSYCTWLETKGHLPWGKFWGRT